MGREAILSGIDSEWLIRYGGLLSRRPPPPPVTSILAERTRTAGFESIVVERHYIWSPEVARRTCKLGIGTRRCENKISEGKNGNRLFDLRSTFIRSAELCKCQNHRTVVQNGIGIDIVYPTTGSRLN